MKLCLLSASNYERLFGSQEDRKVLDVVMIAQTPACDAFLVLTNTVYDGLEPVSSVPDGFIFTYAQWWGLTINDDVVARVILDLRKNAYPPMSEYLDAVVKNDEASIKAYIDACLAVKSMYPKYKS